MNQQKVCSICGTMCGETDSFCPNCGANQFLGNDLEQTAVLFSNESQPAQPAQPYMPPQPAQPAQPYMPPQPAQPAQPAQPYMPPQPVQPPQPYTPPQPVQPAQPYMPPQSVQPPVQPYAQQPQSPASPMNGYQASGFGIPQGVSKKEYIKNYLPDHLVKKLKEVFIACLIGAALNFFVAIAAGNYVGIIDSVLIAGLGFGIYKGRSFACAVIILVYAIINAIYGLVVVGAFIGWLYVIVGVYAVMAFSAINKEYKAYSENNQFHPYG